MTALARPVRIFALEEASFEWFGMLAGMQLDLFTPLDDGPLDAAELAARLGVNAEKLGLLLHALVVAGLLTVDEGRFGNAPEAAQFLVRGKPAYLGSVHTLWEEFSQACLRTAASVRTGVAQARHNYGEMTEKELYVTLGGLHPAGLAKGRALAARYDFGAHRDVLDAAGGSGGVSIGVAEAWPDVRLTIADLPGVVPVARRFIAEAGAGEQISTLACDLVRESPPGRYDAAILSLLIQVLAPAEARAALCNIARALRRGGTAYLLNAVLDDTRLAPAPAARLNVLMLNFYDHGQAYTEGEYRDWLAGAGFVDVTRDDDIAGNALIRARTAG
ncbi:MAG TPA: methyltransferase [Thermomicrobiales bacterium]|nr:methyltransferase [Thermomicrobiales bacterium]